VLVVRGQALEATMSQYLVSRIRAAENIEVRLGTRVVGAQGVDHLELLSLCDDVRGTVEDVPANWLFVFIGASPRTDWLGDDVQRDDKGFLVTGPELSTAGRWPLTRPPFALETSLPGVFAAGDVRLDSMKRVASAVGEGAMAVYLVHRYLATV
jgi:thioredoxin reductase (NADPH)